jgi:hypothetical protein
MAACSVGKDKRSGGAWGSGEKKRRGGVWGSGEKKQPCKRNKWGEEAAGCTWRGFLAGWPLCVSAYSLLTGPLVNY